MMNIHGKQNNLRTHVSVYLLTAFLGILIYANHLQNPFQFDSLVFIKNNPDLAKPRELINLDFLQKEFLSRSLLRITLAWNALLSERNPFGYHLFNLLFHVLNSIFVFVISLKLFSHLTRNQPLQKQEIYLASFLTTILFLCHPIQTESVIYIASRSEILLATFYLTSFFLFQICFDKQKLSTFWIRWLIIFPIIMVLAILGYSIKQSMVTLPAIIFLYYLFILPRNSWVLNFLRRYQIALIVFFLAALLILFSKLMSDERFLIGPSKAGEIIGRKAYMLSQPGVILFYYFKVLLFPFNLNIDPDIAKGTFSLGFFSASSGIILIFFLAFKNVRKRLTGFLAFWFFFTISPSSSIITLQDLAAEHRTYLPSLAFFWISSFGWIMVTKRIENKNIAPYLRSLLAVFLILTWSLGTVERNLEWSSGLRLWEDTLKKSPGKTRPWMNVGHAHILLGNSNEALRYYKKATEMDPYYFASQYNLGTLYQNKGDIDKAIFHFRFAYFIDPYVPEVNGKLGEIYLHTGEYESSNFFLKRAVERNPTYVEAFRNLGVLHYYHLKNKKQALTYFRRSLTLDPKQAGYELVKRLLDENS